LGEIKIGLTESTPKYILSLSPEREEGIFVSDFVLHSGKRERSANHPSLDLATAYKLLHRELQGLEAAELSRDGLAKKLGYTNGAGGAAARKIGALVHFGLMDRRPGHYGLSPLGLRLQSLNLDDPEFPSAIRAALQNPVLFRNILDRYRPPGFIPDDLSSQLAVFGIQEAARDQAARVFRSSALFARVIDSDGRFCQGAAIPPESTDLQSSSAADRLEEVVSVWSEVPLMLTDGKFAWLKVPRHMTTEDFTTLGRVLLVTYNSLPEHLGFDRPKEEEGPGILESPKAPLSFPPRRGR
jgi:hypothetical protein